MNEELGRKGRAKAILAGIGAGSVYELARKTGLGYSRLYKSVYRVGRLSDKVCRAITAAGYSVPAFEKKARKVFVIKRAEVGDEKFEALSEAWRAING